MQRLGEPVSSEAREGAQDLDEHAGDGVVESDSRRGRARELDGAAVAHTQTELLQLSVAALCRVNGAPEDRREGDLAETRPRAIPECPQAREQQLRLFTFFICAARKASGKPCVHASLVSSGFRHF